MLAHARRGPGYGRRRRSSSVCAWARSAELGRCVAKKTRTSRSQPCTDPTQTRCWMFGAGCPSQPWSTRKLPSRGGHAERGGKSLRPRPTVSAQTRTPSRESFLKLPKRATGRMTEASRAVTATTSDGLSAPARSTSQPEAGRNVAGGDIRAEAPMVAVASATTKAASSTRPRVPTRRLRVGERIGPSSTTSESRSSGCIPASLARARIAYPRRCGMVIVAARHAV